MRNAQEKVWSCEVPHSLFSRYHYFLNAIEQPLTLPQNFVQKDEIREAIVQAMVPPEG